MHLTIATTFYGDAARWRPWLLRWLAAVARHAPDASRVILVPEHGCTLELPPDVPGATIQPCALAPWREVIRPEWPFDLKGALLCSALNSVLLSDRPTVRPSAGILYLDLDAVLVADPQPALEGFAAVPFALPLDWGAVLKARQAPPMRIAPPFQDTVKHCAGIMWFGAGCRGPAIAAEYTASFAALRPVRSEEARLLEQNAWSLVHHRRAAAELPDTFNWPAHKLGPNPRALVEHAYGPSKWRETSPASRERIAV